jgi:hypothetical protein
MRTPLAWLRSCIPPERRDDVRPEPPSFIGTIAFSPTKPVSAKRQRKPTDASYWSLRSIWKKNGILIDPPAPRARGGQRRDRRAQAVDDHRRREAQRTIERLPSLVL